ncbi:MAG: SGNH/GDSL hydrolase family protein [Armatimonadetes bacterium]|jgi:lysophospholipase L1-like esterase|nr:SGNH/GDSL hydrolase family protein [Armatimonadota bacterium]
MSEFLFQHGQKVLFIGDSITDCGRRAEHAPFGAGYVKLAIDLITARYPDRHITYLNEGIGGNTVEDLHARWHDDVLVHQPHWLSVKIGINDLHRTLNGGADAIPPARFAARYREILQRTAKETDAHLILIDPFYISVEKDPDTQRGKVLALLPEYLAVVRELAVEFGAIHVRAHEAFQEQLRYRPAELFCPEPVHPNLGGHLVLAHALLAQLGW